MNYYFILENGVEHQIHATDVDIYLPNNPRFRAFTTDELQFYTQHPNATIREIINLQMTPEYIPTLEDKKREKIDAIIEYDVSDNVNSFVYNGVNMWLDRDTRVALVNTLNSAEMLNIDSINIWYAGMCLPLTCTEARQLLAAIEIYATSCYNVTEQHKVNVNALQTITDVENYDYTQGYPARLNLTSQTNE